MAAETEASSNSLLQQLEEEARSNRKLAQEQLLEEVEQLKERIEMVQLLPKLARFEADLAKLREELVRSFSTLIRCSSCCVCIFFLVIFMVPHLPSLPHICPFLYFYLTLRR